jgi:hypothetical protein
MSQPNSVAAQPGFITVMLDVPFGLAFPNGSYRVFDPAKSLAVVQCTLREGSRAFFRSVPIIGPTSFADLSAKACEYQRPREDYSYVATSVLQNGHEKATLNVHCGVDGGFAESKYYSELQVTFLEDDLGVIDHKNNYVLDRAADILNAFLDKYRLIAEDYRASRVSADRNYYVAVCHTSPLTADERGMDVDALFGTLAVGRTFHQKLGHGAANILRTNSLDHLGPPPQMDNRVLNILIDFVREPYEMPLSYDLVMQALRSLQLERDTKLAILHAATAVEVHVLQLLHKVLVGIGRTPAAAWDLLELDPDYEGVAKRIKRLESHTKEHCNVHHSPYSAFVGGPLYGRWKDVLARKRNRAVHAGVASFGWTEAAEAIGIAKEVIVFLDNRVPAISNQVRLNPSVAGLRESAGGILF